MLLERHAPNAPTENHHQTLAPHENLDLLPVMSPKNNYVVTSSSKAAEPQGGQHDFQEPDEWASRQPLMDFMMNDMDTTLPGMFEDVWYVFPPSNLSSPTPSHDK